MSEKRDTFSSRVGFVLAAAGSAVGLGNLWRFPYLAAQKGGAVFLLVYVIFALTFGLALLITEISIGRRTRLSCIGAYKKMNSKFGFLGLLTALVPTIILPYYSVIGGWVTKYGVSYIANQSGDIAKDSESFFTNFITVQANGFTNNALFWFILFMVITTVIVLLGVQKGVEKASKIMMPLLILLSIGIGIYTITIPGVVSGLKYYLVPNFSFIKSFKDVADLFLSALGQLFYSLSLAMAIMLTYGSYMKKDDDIQKSSVQIVVFDSLVAFLAGFMIVPPVVAFNGGDPTKINAGPGLMFVTLPQVFAQMPGGKIVGALFFILVFFAALTSSISLMEAVVSVFLDKFKINRTVATLIVFVISIVLGTLSCLGYGPLGHIKLLGREFLDFFDFITNSVMMPIIAILTCILVGFIAKPKFVEEEVLKSGEFKAKKAYEVMVKYIAPIFLAAILISNLVVS
ncbi:MAG: sodium-dependent transporter [Clostridia bacterium]|nr:sodium-dependent transporter [Clostridia bacterium]